jgi:hypothetical protein
MADEIHLKILEQGVKAYNKKRDDNLYREPNLMNANFNGADLIGTNLYQVDMSKAILVNTKLELIVMEMESIDADQRRFAPISGRLEPEWVAGFKRNRQPTSSGLPGRLHR